MSKVTRRYTDKELLQLLRIWSSDFNKTPSQREILDDDRLPTHHTYIKRFGSVSEAMALAGLDQMKDASVMHDAVGFLLSSSGFEITGEKMLVNGRIIADFIVNSGDGNLIVDVVHLLGVDQETVNSILAYRKTQLDMSGLPYFMITNLEDLNKLNMSKTPLAV